MTEYICVVRNVSPQKLGFCRKWDDDLVKSPDLHASAIDFYVDIVVNNILKDMLITERRISSQILP